MNSSISSFRRWAAAYRAPLAFLAFTIGGILAWPFVMWGMNVAVLSRFYVLPPGIRAVDAPLYSYMMLTPNYAGDVLKLRITDGLTRIPHRTNRFGMRGEEPDVSRPLVMLSGDSTLFGLWLHENETLPARMQQMFGTRYAVLNNGVPGKSVLHNLVALEQFIRIARRENAKAAVYVDWLYRGDLDFKDMTLEEIRRKWLRRDLTRFDRIRIDYPILLEIYRLWRDPGTVAGGPALEFITNALDVSLPRRVLPSNRPATPPERLVAVDSNLQAITEMEALAASCGVALLHVVLPSSPEEVTADGGYDDQMVEAVRRAGGQHVLNLKTPLRRHFTGDAAARLGGSVGHFNAEGATVIAPYLVEAIGKLPGVAARVDCPIRD